MCICNADTECRSVSISLVVDEAECEQAEHTEQYGDAGKDDEFASHLVVLHLEDGLDVTLDGEVRGHGRWEVGQRSACEVGGWIWAIG